MSSQLPLVNLAGASVGTTATINFSAFEKFNPLDNDPAHLRVFNDSGCGLKYVMQSSGNSDYIPAGGWATIELMDNDSAMNITVVYILPNPPVSLILPTYYRPGEAVPETPILGNSPIGGGVNSSSVQTLSNEVNGTAFKVIDIGTSVNNDLLDIFTDSFLWKVLQAGVVHQVLKGSTSGSPLQLGQAGDITEVLGQLTVDQLLTAALGLTFTGGTLNYNVSATAPTVSTNGQTIATAGLSVSRVTCNTNGLTGFILQSGTVNGQQVIVLVEGVSGSFTFDVAATSHVAGGTGVAIGTGFAALFVWDSSTSFWYTTQ